MTLNATVAKVTARIAQRSQATRKAYLQQVEDAAARKPGADRLGCANVAHAFAAMPAADKTRASGLAAIPVVSAIERGPNIGVVTAYNDLLSAHAPFQHYPDWVKDEARKWGATAQVAGGVPAMCDGVTQGTPGMELSLFSRDVIAMSTAVSLSHDVFDAALMLGVCDKIVPGLLIGALQFGHLPTVFVPAGPMGSGLSNDDKSKVREQAAQGRDQARSGAPRGHSTRGQRVGRGLVGGTQSDSRGRDRGFDSRRDQEPLGHRGRLHPRRDPRQRSWHRRHRDTGLRRVPRQASCRRGLRECGQAGRRQDRSGDSDG